MTRPLLLCVLILTTACGGRSASTPTSSSPATAALSTVPVTPSGYRQIRVGEDVAGLLDRGDLDIFELLTDFDGDLLLRLAGDAEGTPELWVDDTVFAASRTSPITGRKHVVAGGRYRVRVTDFPARDYGPWSLRYVLTAVRE
jgi:hypothetical protein